jgi:hypothetical protein
VHVEDTSRERAGELKELCGVLANPEPVGHDHVSR